MPKGLHFSCKFAISGHEIRPSHRTILQALSSRIVARLVIFRGQTRDKNIFQQMSQGAFTQSSDPSSRSSKLDSQMASIFTVSNDDSWRSLAYNDAAPIPQLVGQKNSQQHCGYGSLPIFWFCVKMVLLTLSNSNDSTMSLASTNSKWHTKKIKTKNKKTNPTKNKEKEVTYLQKSLP